MQTVNLQVEENYFKKFLELLKTLPSDKVHANFQYTDELGDTIVVIDGEEYVKPTPEDRAALQAAHAELERGETVTLNEIEGSRQGV